MREIKFNIFHDSTLYNVSTVHKPRDNRGSHNFKGWQKRQGYIARLTKGHPFADSRGYVMEHRLLIEEKLGRFLEADEIVHHKNHIRDDNNIENLEIYADQKRHAAGHAASMERDGKAQTWVPDPKLAEKKFRLLNKNTGLMETKNLSQLINTTYRKSQFEYRGEATGLKDKNGKPIYEGDILDLHSTVNGVNLFEVYYNEKEARFSIKYYTNLMPKRSLEYEYSVSDFFKPCEFSGEVDFEIIGNIYENPDLIG